MNGSKIIYRYTVCKIRISCDTSWMIMHYYYTMLPFFNSDNDGALQSHISLPFLPFLISTMPTTGAHTGFQGILL